MAYDLEHYVNQLLDSRDIAMRFTWQARIPECGEFAAIAQNLDWLCNDFNLNTD